VSVNFIGSKNFDYEQNRHIRVRILNNKTNINVLIFTIKKTPPCFLNPVFTSFTKTATRSRSSLVSHKTDLILHFSDINMSKLYFIGRKLARSKNSILVHYLMSSLPQLVRDYQTITFIKYFAGKAKY